MSSYLDEADILQEYGSCGNGRNRPGYQQPVSSDCDWRERESCVPPAWGATCQPPCQDRPGRVPILWGTCTSTGGSPVLRSSSARGGPGWERTLGPATSQIRSASPPSICRRCSREEGMGVAKTSSWQQETPTVKSARNLKNHKTTRTTTAKRSRRINPRDRMLEHA